MPMIVLSVCENALPAIAWNRVAVVMVSVRGAITMLRDCVVVSALGTALSVSFSTKLDVPVAVGVPVMVPLVLSLSPAGSDPEARDHVHGGTPPPAGNVAENGRVTLP